MTEKTHLIPNKPYYAIYQNAATALLYSEDTPKRLMYIDACNICRHCVTGRENGGMIDMETCEPEDIWYYCKHPSNTGWPIRIGQDDKITTIGLGNQCPLESIIKVNDDLIKIEEPKKERAKRTPLKEQSDIQTQTTVPPS
jgi:hypothetical protein